MQLALWHKSIRDAAVMFVSLVVVLVVFHVLFVWMSSKIGLVPSFDSMPGVDIDALQKAFTPEGDADSDGKPSPMSLATLLKAMLKDFEKLSGVPFQDVATRSGLLALGYVDPVVLFAFVIWGIGRGSDTISGPLGRGTLEMIAAQPVRRVAILVPQFVVMSVGCFLLAAACWIGTCVGIAIVPLEETVDPLSFLPAAANLFGLGFFLAGTTTLISSVDNHRARTIGIAGGFFIVQLIIKIVARMAEGWEWLLGCTFLGAFEPQVLVRDSQTAWAVLAYYNGILVGLGLAAFIAAGLIFARRDLPAPL